MNKIRIPACAAIALAAALAMTLSSAVRADANVDRFIEHTTINFDFDSARLRPDGLEKLVQFIRVLRENVGINLRVVGYTDSTGPDDYNKRLSWRRAKSVVDYMIGSGINGVRLSLGGEGEADPLVPNNTSAGRAVNRRVQFQVM